MAKKTREELEALELRALEEAVRELNKFYEEDNPADAFPFGAFLGATAKEASAEAAPAQTAPAEAEKVPADGKAQAPADAPEKAPAAEAETAPAAAQTPTEEAPVKKPGRTRSTAKKTAASEKTTAAKKTASTKKASETKKASGAKKAAGAKKAFVPHFVIQNSSNSEITYESVVEKVQAALAAAEVASLDIYVKAEEGKAYYVVNGETAGSVDLF